MATLALAAVGGTRREACVTLAADSLFAVILGSKSLKRGLDDRGTTTQTENQMQSGLLLDVILGKSAAVLKLLASEDKTLLVRRNTFLVADLALHSFDGIIRLHFKSDSLSGQGLDKDLHVNGKTGEGETGADEVTKDVEFFECVT